MSPMSPTFVLIPITTVINLVNALRFNVGNAQPVPVTLELY